MILVTASTITLALTQDAEILAVYAMIGGFSTPALVSTGENHEIILFSYVLLLDLAILAMVSFKPWRRIVWGAMVGTAIMYVGWAAQYYDSSERHGNGFVCFSILCRLCAGAAAYAAYAFTLASRHVHYADAAAAGERRSIFSGAVCHV